MKTTHSVIRKILEKDSRVVFAYLYGSARGEKHYRDIDIGVYIIMQIDRRRIKSYLYDIKKTIFLLAKQNQEVSDRS